MEPTTTLTQIVAASLLLGTVILRNRDFPSLRACWRPLEVILRSLLRPPIPSRVRKIRRRSRPWYE